MTSNDKTIKTTTATVRHHSVHHTYVAGFTYEHGDLIEICNRCGTIRDVGNHFDEKTT